MTLYNRDICEFVSRPVAFKSYPNFVSRSYRDDEKEKFMFDDPTAVYVYLNVHTCDTCNNVFRILDYLLVILTLQYNEPRILLE